jgi:hypothetical protein
MWKAKLNQHFAKFAFLLWNLIFHSLWLSALFFISSGSHFNSLWSENQLLFATLSIALLAFVYRDEWIHKLRDSSLTRTFFLRGIGLALAATTLIVLESILLRQSEFLGLSSQIGANFLSSYGWLLRCVLLMGLSLALNATTKTLSPYWTGLILQYFFFWIWFQPGFHDYLLITAIYLLHSSIPFSTGLMGGLFLFTHAVFGSPFMGTDFSGLFQVKWQPAEQSLLQHPALILGLFFIPLVNKLKPFLRNRKEWKPL